MIGVVLYDMLTSLDLVLFHYFSIAILSSYFILSLFSILKFVFMKLDEIFWYFKEFLWLMWLPQTNLEVLFFSIRLKINNFLATFKKDHKTYKFTSPWLPKSPPLSLEIQIPSCFNQSRDTSWIKAGSLELLCRTPFHTFCMPPLSRKLGTSPVLRMYEMFP